MSMLSSMCERLRVTADEVERIKHNNADWLWRDGVTLMDAVRKMRDAADTIDHLRRTCNDLQAENEHLRDTMSQMAYDHAEQGREVRALKALVRDMWHELDAATQYDAGGGRGIVFELANSMRDLGVEVQ